MAQAGDKRDFIGTLIVVPDVGQMQTAGATVSWIAMARTLLVY